MVFVQIGVVDGYVRYERLPVEIVDGEGPWLEVTHGLDLGAASRGQRRGRAL